MTNTIIVGGGISGLYAAYKLKEKNPKEKVLVLEKQHKKNAGGRTGNDLFRGTNVVTGAGVGRKKKDVLLRKLLQELNIDTEEFPASHHYAETIEPKCSVKKTFLELKAAYRGETNHRTFKEFALSILGEQKYKHFITCSGYSDYENEDAHGTLYQYGFDDNYNEWTGLMIPWDKMVKTLLHKIGLTNIHFNCAVENINIVDNGFKVITKARVFEATRVIIASTIDTFLKILPIRIDKGIYKQIHGQPFLRTYGQFSESSRETIKKYVHGLTVVPGPIQKIIPMDVENGVYMICYNDNKSASLLHNFSSDTKENRDFFAKLLEKSLGAPENSLHLLSIKGYYWKVGTHYYEPLGPEYKSRKEFIKKAQHPYKNLFIVGEMISNNQGWVEGTLDSVERIL
jgi:hypothetical protein